MTSLEPIPPPSFSDTPRSFLLPFMGGGLLLLAMIGAVVAVGVPEGAIRGTVTVLTGVIILWIAGAIFGEWTSRQPWVVWNSRNVILLGVIWWLFLDPLQFREGLEEFPAQVLLLSLTAGLVFMIAVVIGYQLPPLRGLARVVASGVDPPDVRGPFAAVALVFLVGVAPMIISTGGSYDVFVQALVGSAGDPSTPMGWRRGALGDARGFALAFFVYFLWATPFLGAWALTATGMKGLRRLIVLAAIASVLLIVFFSGARRIFAFLVVGPMLYLYGISRHRPRLRVQILFPAIALSLLVIMQVQVRMRGVGLQAFDPTVIETNPAQMHRDNNFYWLATAVESMPERYAFTNDWPFLYLVYHPIPRFIWPGKPAQAGFPFVRWEDIGASLSASVIGELYMARGFLGVVIGGLVYGWLARTWDQVRQLAVRRRSVQLLYCMGLAVLLVGVRSFNDVVALYYTLALAWVVFWIIRRRSARVRLQSPDTG